MGKFILAAFFAFFLFACDNGGGNSATAGEGGGDSTKTIGIISSDGVRHDFKIELAITPPQQEHGLMDRTHMDENAGMLFMFGGEDERAFWMKNTLIPLDMVFIKKDGTIHKVHDSAVPNDLTSIPSDGPVMAVLELNGGIAKKLGIKAGDKAHHPFFGNAFSK